MVSTDEKENKRKFAWWVKDSTIELVGKLYKDDDCTSRSEFIEKAVIFYADISAQKMQKVTCRTW